MLRTFVGALVALVICAGSLLAEEIKGKVAKVDAEKNTLTLTVNGKDQTFPIDKEAKFLTSGKKKQLQDLPGGLSGVKEGTEVTLTTEKKDGKEVVTKVTAAGRNKKKDKAQPPTGNLRQPINGNLKVGMTAPDFTVKDVDGKNSVKLSELRGKPVVLIFGSCT